MLRRSFPLFIVFRNFVILMLITSVSFLNFFSFAEESIIDNEDEYYILWDYAVQPVGLIFSPISNPWIISDDNKYAVKIHTYTAKESREVDITFDLARIVDSNPVYVGQGTTTVGFNDFDNIPDEKYGVKMTRNVVSFECINNDSYRIVCKYIAIVGNGDLTEKNCYFDIDLADSSDSDNFENQTKGITDEFAVTVGSDSEICLIIQKMLSAISFLNDEDSTGIYNAKTVLAVSEYQNHINNVYSLNIPITGECDTFVLGILSYEYQAKTKDLALPNSLIDKIDQAIPNGKGSVEAVEVSLILSTLIQNDGLDEDIQKIENRIEYMLSLQNNYPILDRINITSEDFNDVISEIVGLINSLLNNYDKMLSSISLLKEYTKSETIILISEYLSHLHDNEVSRIRGYGYYINKCRDVDYDSFDYRTHIWGDTIENVKIIEGDPFVEYESDDGSSYVLVYQGKNAFTLPVSYIMYNFDVNKGLDRVLIEFQGDISSYMSEIIQKSLIEFYGESWIKPASWNSWFSITNQSRTDVSFHYHDSLLDENKVFLALNYNEQQ